MVSFVDLKKINILKELGEPMLGKMLPFTRVHLFGAGANIFRQGQKADRFYMLLKGKVLLEVEASESISISLGAIKASYSFGWSALVPGSQYTSSATCTEPCEVLAISGDTFLEILEQDHSMGFRVMEGVVSILKRRLERRTSQFLKTLRALPDIKDLFVEDQDT